MQVKNFFDEEMKASDGLKSRLGWINANAIVRTLDAHKMSMFGSKTEPVSEHIRVMVTYIDPHKSQVMMVLSDGQLVLYGTDDSLSPEKRFDRYLKMTNEELIEISEAHVISLMNGGEGHIFFSKYPADNFPVMGLNHFSSAYTKGVDGFTSLCHSWMLEKLDCPSFHDKKVIGSMLTLRSMIRKRLGACRKTILNALDEDVRQAMYRNLESSTQLLSRLTGADKMRYREDAARRKEEAMKLVNQYPAFTGMLREADSHTLREIDGYGDMRRGISKDCGLSEAQIRVFKGKTVHSLINIQGSKRGQSQGSLLHRHIRYQQKLVAPWLCYHDYSPDELRTFPPKLLSSVHDFCEGSFSDKFVPEEISALKKKMLREVWKDNEIAAMISNKHNASYTKDVLNFVYRDIIIPMSGRGDPSDRRKLARFMLPTSFSRMLTCSAIYHKPEVFNRQKFNEVMRTKGHLVGWSTLIGRFEHEGIVCRELNTREDLISQGEKEGHCVGGYTSSVLNINNGWANLIFSIEKDEEILSTLSILINDKMEARVSQNYAKYNTEPSEEAVITAANLMLHISSTKSHEELVRYMSSIRETAENFTENFSEVNRDGLREAWPLYRNLLSKRAMKMPGLLACLEEARKT